MSDVKKTELKLLENINDIPADDRPVEMVPVPEWGCIITLRAMTGARALAFARESDANKELKDLSMFRIIAACAINSKGEPLFADFNVLMSKGMGAINRLQRAAMKLNGYDKDVAEATKKD